MDEETIIGISASFFTSITLLPQLIKILKEKDGNGTSYLMLLVLMAGLALWILYGVMRRDAIIIIANSVSLAFNLTTLVFTYVYRKGVPGK